jgi:hypothetical protein
MIGICMCCFSCAGRVAFGESLGGATTRLKKSLAGIFNMYDSGHGVLVGVYTLHACGNARVTLIRIHHLITISTHYKKSNAPLRSTMPLSQLFYNIHDFSASDIFLDILSNLLHKRIYHIPRMPCRQQRKSTHVHDP